MSDFAEASEEFRYRAMAQPPSQDAGAYAIAYAILMLADAQYSISRQPSLLGNADATTHLGAIEHLAIQIKDGAEVIAIALSGLAQE